jgi:hypothetical protein
LLISHVENGRRAFRHNQPLPPGVERLTKPQPKRSTKKQVKEENQGGDSPPLWQPYATFSVGSYLFSTNFILTLRFFANPQTPPLMSGRIRDAD